MKRKTLALTLAAVLALSLTDAAALAAGGSIVVLRSSPGGNVSQGGVVSERPDFYVPDPAGIVTFENLERRMRENNLNVLVFQENIQAIRSTDYDEMREDIRKGLNEIANRQWQMVTGIPMLGSMMAASLDAQYDALRETFDDIKEGKLQADNEDLIWQLENAQDQLIMAGETLYITLANLECSGKALDRGLETLDRTTEELELRFQLGHISAQTLEQARAGKTSLLSSQETLNSNIETCKMQLEMFIGSELTGEIQLGALPQVTDEQLQEMDLERDLAKAKKASYSLYTAKQTLDQAEEDFEDKGKEYNHNDKHFEYVQAQHQWQAAQHTYNAAVQSFEMGLRTLYLKVKDNKQVLDAARDALATEQSSFAVSQLKYEQGSLSANALAEAEDKVKQAQETVDSAVIELFSSYHSYRWAVDHGILNT